MSVGLTAPLVAAGGMAIKTAMDFESAFTGIAKTVDGTDEQIQQLEDNIRALATGDSPVAALENAATELAAIGEAAGQLGVGIDDIEEFSTVVGELSMASNIAGEEGATMIAQFANVTKMPLSDIRNFADTIVTLGNNAATTENDILSMASRMGSIADVGFNPEEILAYSSSLASLGITAEAGGTNFVKGVNEIAKAVANGGDALDEMASIADMTTSQFTEAFADDASGAIQSFIEGLGDLDRVSQLEALNSLGIQGQEAERVFLSLAGNTELLASQLDMAGSAMQGNNALLDEATKRAETAQGNFNKFRNSITELSASFGEVLLPAFTSVVEGLTGLINWLSNLPAPVKNIIVVIGGLLAALGPVLMIIGSIGSGIGALGTAFGAVSAAAGFLMPVITGLISGFMAIAPAIMAALLPIAPLILAIGGLAVALNFWETSGATETWRANFEMLGVIVEKGSQRIGNTLQESGKTWGTNFEMLGTIFGKVKDRIGQTLSRFVPMIVESFRNLLPAMQRMGTNIIQGLINGVQSKVSEFVGMIQNMASSAMNTVKSAFGIASPSKVMEGFGKNVVEGFNQGIDKMGGIGVNVPSMSSANNSRQPTIGMGMPAMAAGGGINIGQMVLPPGTPEDIANDVMRRIDKKTKQFGARKLR